MIKLKKYPGVKLMLAMKKTPQEASAAEPVDKFVGASNAELTGKFIGYPSSIAYSAMEEPVGRFIGYPAMEEHDEYEKMVENGVSLPETPTYTPGEKDSEDRDIENINIKYSIEFRDFYVPGIQVYVHIFYDPKSRELIYNLVEPAITAEEKKMVEEMKNYIQQKIDINFSEVKSRHIQTYIDKAISRAMGYFGYSLDDAKKAALKYYVLRDFVGLERVEPLLADNNIEDISCDGRGIYIYVYHRNSKIGSLRTNIKFEDDTELDSFTNRLGERCGKVISISHPLLNGTLPDGSRVQATLGTDIARRGSNFTIRMFTEKPLTPVDLLLYRSIDARLMAYCWFMIEYGKSFLVSGGTATGKTSLLNALSLFIKPQMKIVSIEDTAELRLPHMHWVPEVARVSISDATAQVDMFSLLKESLRQRPDYIIVGEVRGKEAYVLFQQMAVGHPGLATIHAEDFEKLVDRLTTEPIGLPSHLLQSLDVIMFPKRIKKGRKFMRRLSSISEVIGFDTKKNIPVKNEVFVWDAIHDKYVMKNKSVLLRKITQATGITDKEIHEEIKRRAAVINWMAEKGMNDYQQVGAVIDAFYASPETLMDKIGG